MAALETEEIEEIAAAVVDLVVQTADLEVGVASVVVAWVPSAVWVIEA